MIIDIKIPSPGESINEVELTTWFVNDGDFVEKDQEIAELESDKATLTLSADKAGVIAIVANEGDTLEVGFVACSIDTDKPRPEGAPAPPPSTKETNNKDTHEKTDANPNKEELKITPVAKKILDDKGISEADFLSKLKRITSKEIDLVLSFNENDKVAAPQTSKERSTERTKMTPLRKKLSKRLVQVKNQTAMLTTFNEVNMASVMQLRSAYKNQFQEKYGTKLGFMSFFTKAASIALQHHPNINAMIDDEEIVKFSYNDIAIAVQTPKGLMVPVVRNVNELNLAETELEIARLAKKAREAKISLDEMSGGTFTITNGGVFGSLLSTPIINPPQSGILGMHNIVERPIAENGQVVIRPMMYIALSYDHRLVDGKDSVGFLVKLKELIEQPEKMLFNGENIAEKLILG